jgi:hypothetical protein
MDHAVVDNAMHIAHLHRGKPLSEMNLQWAKKKTQKSNADYVF